MKRDFLPTISLERLKARAAILKKLRLFFDQRNFTEVETPLLSNDTCVDRHLQPIGVSPDEIWDSDPKTDCHLEKMWLQTSPEFAMKRLIAAGADAIYQITKSFRAGERGRLHNPEFTMLEWYRVGDNLQSGMDLLADLVQEILASPTVVQISYCDLFQFYLKVDPHCASTQELSRLAQKNGITIESFYGSQNDRDFWLNLLLTHLIEPVMDRSNPIIVFDWPASQSALAIVRDGDPPLAERFELYVGGIEIANGYHELLDPHELSKRNRANNKLRFNEGKRELPENSRLLHAMEHGIPACAGVALGVDRLVMLATGAESIEEVMAFPIDRA